MVQSLRLCGNQRNNATRQRAFGIGALHPVPNNSSVPGPSPISPSPSGSTALATPRCAAGSARATLESQNGAAGTMSTVWRITNLASTPCRSFGYPGMAFHTASGWLEVNVIRGGYPNIDEPPTHIEVAPGGSMFFVSYWSDVVDTTGAGDGFVAGLLSRIVRDPQPSDEALQAALEFGCTVGSSVCTELGAIAGLPRLG